MNSNTPYNASLTREPFLFYEMRTTARLMADGLDGAAAIAKITEENLFQYPTEKTIKRIASACVRRLEGMNDESLIHALASQSVEIAKQICLYAMMKNSRLIWEFMLTVIGEKYILKDTSFGKIDLNTFFLRLQEQDDAVATWSEQTITKLKQVITKVLVETEYLDSPRATTLNPVYLYPVLENAIRSNNDDIILPAFNYFS